MIIQHNISALNSWRNTGINTNSTAKSLEKLSSGLKVNRSADDAAGLAISEKMRGQIRGTLMGTQNIKMGINLIQTAEGGLDEVHSMLQRMRELAVQSSNGTYQDEDRAELDKEFQTLKEAIDNLSEYTNYNGITLLNVPLNNDAAVRRARDIIQDSYDTVTAPGGTNAQIAALFTEFGTTSPTDLAALQSIASRLASTVEIANDAFVDVINAVNGLIDELGDEAFDPALLANYRTQRYVHYDDKPHYIGTYLGPSRTGAAAALATSDPATAHAALATAFNAAWGGGGGIVACHEPVADAAWALLENVTLPETKNPIWIQIGANSGDGMNITRCDSRTPAIGVDQTAVDPLEAANDAISFIDNAINIISSYRANFGASQNRLESAERNNGVKTENLQAAESTIRDADMAKVMMEFTKNNILVQASQSMLAQANQLPQGVLSLLQ